MGFLNGKWVQLDDSDFRELDKTNYVTGYGGPGKYWQFTVTEFDSYTNKYIDTIVLYDYAEASKYAIANIAEYTRVLASY